MVKNRKREHKPPPGVKRKCTKCPKLYMFQFNLDRHYEIAHDPDKPNKSKNAKGRGKSCQCDICGSVFRRSDILRNHKKTVHEGIKRLRPNVISTCDICGSVFKRKDHLKEHVLVKHSGSALPYACNVCEKSFIRQRMLDVHMNKHHFKLKPYSCSFCTKKFFSQHSANNHIALKVCQPDRVKRFKCIECEKTFYDAQLLEMHMTAWHFGGAYSCVCGDVVRWLGSVAKHKRKCKSYQEYVKVNGEAEGKVFNIFEVPYADVLLEKTSDTNEPPQNCTIATVENTIGSIQSAQNSTGITVENSTASIQTQSSPDKTVNPSIEHNYC